MSTESSISKLMETFERFPMYKQGDWEKSTDATPYFLFTLFFGVVVFLFEHYLEYRQLAKFKTAKAVPRPLVDMIPSEKFHKSIAYQKDKTETGIFESSFMFAEGLALAILGYLPYCWDFASKLSVKWGFVGAENSALYTEIVASIFFVFLITLHDLIIGLPFSLYNTFVIEERHGFNKSTLKVFFKDKILMLGLTLLIGSPILSALVYIIRLGGPHFYYYVWFFLFIVSVFLMSIYPTYIAPLFNKYTPLDEGELFEAIKKMAKEVSFPLTKIFVVDGSTRSAHSNAYFYGFFKNKRIVLFDTLIKQVEQPELLAILGHEIGHWRLWHTIQGFVISQIYTFLMFMAFSYVQNSPGLFSAFGFACSDTSTMPVLIGLVLFSQTFWSPVDKVLSFFLNVNSRANEFAADRYAVSLGYGKELAAGLIKISIENSGNLVPDGLYSTYHYTHPPLVERLAAIPGSDNLKPLKFKKEEDPSVQVDGSTSADSISADADGKVKTN